MYFCLSVDDQLIYARGLMIEMHCYLHKLPIESFEEVFFPLGLNSICDHS